MYCSGCSERVVTGREISSTFGPDQLSINMSDYKFLATSQSLISARKVIEHLKPLIRRPQSLLDVGCGVGGWSMGFREWGTEELILVDHPSNKKENILFSDHSFHTADMNQALPPVFRTEMAICLEVLEHLEPHRSQAVIEYLTRCSDTILFSAAIPGQGGYRHINEQYAFYWENIFSSFGFQRYDIIRPAIIWDTDIEYFIRQNTFLYVKNQGLLFSTDHPAFIPADFELIHRKVLTKHRSPIDLLKKMPDSFLQSLRHRLGKK